MRRKERSILIDARPRFGAAVAALLPLGEATLVERHLELAKRLGAEEVWILEEAGSVSAALPHLAQGGVKFCSQEPPGDRLRLSTGHLYRERSPKVAWTLRSADDIKNAEGELERAELFTISKHTLRPMGKHLAAWLFAHTGVKANHLTGLRIVSGLCGAYFFSQGTFETNLLAAFCVLFSWFMDLTDGQLARLRGEMSKFGAYLDCVGDGVVDNLYYLAIAFAGYRETASEAYLLLGAGFLFGKYVFVNSTLLAPAAQSGGGKQAPRKPRALSPLRRAVKMTLSKMDETDIRIHFLALCAAVNAPEISLIFHAAYFNARWMLNLLNAFYKYEIKKEAS